MEELTNLGLPRIDYDTIHTEQMSTSEKGKTRDFHMHVIADRNQRIQLPLQRISRIFANYEFIFKMLDINSRHIGLELLPLEQVWDHVAIAACIPYFMLGPVQGDLYTEAYYRQAVQKTKQNTSSSSASGNRRSPSNSSFIISSGEQSSA